MTGWTTVKNDVAASSAAETISFLSVWPVRVEFVAMNGAKTVN